MDSSKPFITEYFGKSLVQVSQDVAQQANPEKVAYFQIRLFSKLFLTMIRSKLAELGVQNPAYASVLHALRDGGKLTPGELRYHVLTGASNMTSLIDRMERDGLVVREKDSSDRRKILIKLSDPGMELCTKFYSGFTDWVNEIFSVFEGEDFLQLQLLLGRLWQSLQDHSPTDTS